MNQFKLARNTPWKLKNELLMYATTPLAAIYFAIKKVDIGAGFKFYGLPKVMRHAYSKISIGNNFENRNTWYSNPLGISHPTIICTWEKDAVITIGNNVGISGGAIVASKSITIGDGSIIGANAKIIDTDFHPIDSKSRRYEKIGIKSAPVKIGKNVFIGMNAIILKGVVLPDDAIVPAGEVVRSNHKHK